MEPVKTIELENTTIHIMPLEKEPTEEMINNFYKILVECSVYIESQK